MIEEEEFRSVRGEVVERCLGLLSLANENRGEEMVDWLEAAEEAGILTTTLVMFIDMLYGALLRLPVAERQEFWTEWRERSLLLRGGIEP